MGTQGHPQGLSWPGPVSQRTHLTRPLLTPDGHSRGDRRTTVSRWSRWSEGGETPYTGLYYYRGSCPRPPSHFPIDPRNPSRLGVRYPPRSPRRHWEGPVRVGCPLSDPEVCRPSRSGILGVGGTILPCLRPSEEDSGDLWYRVWKVRVVRTPGGGSETKSGPRRHFRRHRLRPPGRFGWGRGGRRPRFPVPVRCPPVSLPTGTRVLRVSGQGWHCE